jgi:hypothetical protein
MQRMDEHGNLTPEFKRFRFRENLRVLRARILHFLTLGLADGIWY